MKCEEIFEKISEYIDKELDPSLCKDIEEHVENCEPCIAFINTLKKTVELFKGISVETPEIPDNVSSNLKSFLKETIATDEEITEKG